jgi:ribosomal protein L35AE/L33A
MYILHIEHPVMDYAGWKAAFDNDPAAREKSGVSGYRVMRAADDPNYVMIDLEFETKKEAEDFLSAMKVIWGRVEGKIMINQQARIAEIVETKKY